MIPILIEAATLAAVVVLANIAIAALVALIVGIVLLFKGIHSLFHREKTHCTHFSRSGAQPTYFRNPRSTPDPSPYWGTSQIHVPYSGHSGPAYWK